MNGDKIFILETDRLRLRELSYDDIENLKSVLQDADIMYAYEHAFSDGEVEEWLLRQINRYKSDGFGLWAVELKATGEFIGQCGLTLQDADGKTVIEAGYLFAKNYWHNGYAVEAASACKNYAFIKLNADEVYSIIRDNNSASKKVAVKNGMTVKGSFVKHYYGIDMPHLIYSVSRGDE